MIGIEWDRPEGCATISELRAVYQAVWGVRVDAANFQRKIRGTPDFLVPLQQRSSASRGRPARLFRAGAATELSPPMRRPTS